MDRRRAGELETEILTALWTAGAPLSPAALQSATLTQEPNPARTLDHFVSTLTPTDQAHLRALLG